MTRLGLSVLAVLLLACSHSVHGASAPVDFLIVPGVRVGQFEIGRDTASSILGTDTPEARKQFRDLGFEFQFEQGRELTAVTVVSPDYATVEGFRMGTHAADIEAKFGEPLRRIGKFDVPVLAYEGIDFYLAGERVMAIWVGRS